MQTSHVSRLEGGISDAHAATAGDGPLPLAGRQPDPAPPHRTAPPAPFLNSPSGRPSAVEAAAPPPRSTPAGNDVGRRSGSAAGPLQLDESPIVDLPRQSPPTPTGPSTGPSTTASPRPQQWQAGGPVQQLPQHQPQHEEEVWALAPLPAQPIAEPPMEYSQQAPPQHQSQAPLPVPATRSASGVHLAMQHNGPGAHPACAL